MKEKTCCFTGHRDMSEHRIKDVVKTLEKELVQLIEEGCCYFGAGGALGFDTIAAHTVLHLKEKYPHIKLILVLPCVDQAKSWSYEDKVVYEDIKQKADKVVYTSKEYTRGCMHKRNRHLVDNSSVCICYLTENKGGTFYTVNYANSKQLKIVNIAELI